MRYILITGGSGFIGSSLATKLIINSENRVVVFDNLITGKETNIPKSDKCEFVKGDVNNYSSLIEVFKRYPIDVVFHYAAIVGVRRTIDDPISVLNDINGLKNIFELSVAFNIKRIFFSSSSEVYGEPFHVPLNEELTPLNSKLPYAVVKNLGECFCRAYGHKHGLNYTILRFFNTYGPNQSDDFVVSKFLRQAINNKDITIYGNGMQTRTFCYIDDNIDFTIKALNENLFLNETVNVGNNKVFTIKDLAKTIIELTNSSSGIIFLPPLKDGDMSRRLPDITRMKNMYTKDLIDIDEGIRIILNKWNNLTIGK